MKKIAILGSTGSIGTQALDIIRNNRDLYEVEALTAWNSTELLSQQIKEFNPKIAVVSNEKQALELSKEFPTVDIDFGMEGLINAAANTSAELVLNGLVGMVGLKPTYEAIKKKKNIALANKETLIAGGEIIMNEVKKNGVRIIPVDSEHSAIFQCLNSNDIKELDRIILTASGGPFRGYTKEQLVNVTLEDALKHPNWSMGAKITIDSATMMNKGLEVIEAKWLFDISVDKIDIVIHKESIIHSMIEYVDTSVIAQLGIPDMRIPIQYSFSYPKRIKASWESLNLAKVGTLSFEEPNYEVFKCLGLAYDAIKMGGSYPATLNSANEELVNLFLEKKIGFIDIQNTLAGIMKHHKAVKINNIDDIYEIDKETRREVLSLWT